MCGRYYNFISHEELSYVSNNETINDYINYNIIPTSYVPVLINNNIIKARWGFYPSWLKEMKDSKPLINARLETILEKKTFKIPFQKRRCVFLMSGWYEWRNKNNKKIPYAFYYKNYKPLSIAGIYSQRTDGSIEACIMTKNANKDILNIHPRMPVVLEDEVLSHWHDDNISSEILLEKLNKDVENIRFHRVDVAVNNPKNNNDNLYKEYTEVPF